MIIIKYLKLSCFTLLIMLSMSIKAHAVEMKPGIFRTNPGIVESYKPAVCFDNDVTTGQKLSYPNGWVTVVFKEPVSLTGYYLKSDSNNGSLMTATYFNEAGGVIAQKNEAFSQEGLHSDMYGDKVKKVTFNADAYASLMEVELYQKIEYMYILSFSPTNNRSDVALDESIRLVFDKKIKSLDFTISPNVENTVTYVNNECVITPKKGFDYDTEYTFTINSGIAETGHKLPGKDVNRFRTIKDTTPMAVKYIKPPPDAVDVPLSQVIEIGFNKTVNGNTLSGVKVTTGGIEVETLKTVNGNTVQLSFIEPLENEKEYFIEVNGVEDILGNKMSIGMTTKFTTVIDTTELALVSYRPPSGVVPLNQTVELVFNKNVNPDSIKYQFKDSTGKLISSTHEVIGKKAILYPVLKSGEKFSLSDLEASKISGSLQKIPLYLEFEVMKTSGSQTNDSITSDILNFFNYIKSHGVNIILAALMIAGIFIVSRWLWKKTNVWLKTLK